MKKFLSIFVFLTTLPLSAQAFFFDDFGGGTSSELIEEDEQTAAIPYPDYAAKHKVRVAKISPDGKWFATVADEKVKGQEVATLRIWNSETKKKLASHRPAPMGWINGIEFLPDGTGYLLAKPRPQSADEVNGYRFNKAVVWNMDRTIRRRLSWDVEFNWGWCGIAIHPDNQQAAICGQKLPLKNDGLPDNGFIGPKMEAGRLFPYVYSSILLLNIKDGKQINLSGDLTLPKSMPGKLLGYSPDGKSLAFRRQGNYELEGALDDETVVLLDSSSLITSYTSGSHRERLVFSPDSPLAYSVTDHKCSKAAEGEYKCSFHISAKPLQDGKLADKPTSEAKDLFYQWSQWDNDNILAAGPHGLVFAGDTVFLHVTEPGNKGFFRELFKTSLKSKGRRLLAAKFLPDGSAIRFVTSDDTKSMLLKSTAELQQLAERFRIERKACAAFAEAVKLAKVGIWGAMAEKFREGISTAPGMRGSDDSCMPRFQATDIVFNSDVRKHHPRLAQFGALQLELIGSNEKSGGDVHVRFEAWGEYAVMASLAGHPALVAAGVEEMKKLLAAEGGPLNEAVRALEGLALAGMGREDEAFTLLAKDKALKQYAWDVRNRPDAFWPLLGDRARVAYLLDVDESEVPKRSAVRPPAQPFPDPTGRIINPPGMAVDAVAPAPTFSGGVSGGTAMPTPSPTPAGGATILE